MIFFFMAEYCSFFSRIRLTQLIATICTCFVIIYKHLHCSSIMIRRICSVLCVYPGVGDFLHCVTQFFVLYCSCFVTLDLLTTSCVTCTEYCSFSALTLTFSVFWCLPKVGLCELQFSPCFLIHTEHSCSFWGSRRLQKCPPVDPMLLLWFCSWRATYACMHDLQIPSPLTIFYCTTLLLYLICFT